MLAEVLTSCDEGCSSKIIMVEQVLLAVLGFGLGVLATVISQTLSRRLRFADARRKRKRENLQKIRTWMEAYLGLFQCQYPTLRELVFAHHYLNTNCPLYNKAAHSEAYKALKDYREARSKLNEAERRGQLALREFDKRGIFHRFSQDSRFVLAITLQIWELTGLVVQLFDSVPQRFLFYVELDKVDFVQPSEVHTIIHPRQVCQHNEESQAVYGESYLEKDFELEDAITRAEGERLRAELLVDEVLTNASKWENRWIIPDS
jgi:hypothetical protein